MDIQFLIIVSLPFGGEFNRADYPKLWAYFFTSKSNFSKKLKLNGQTEATTNGG